MKNSRGGFFFVFEGIDGAGKSTQAGLLLSHLLRRGYEVEVYREPGGTFLGERLRELLLSPAYTDLEPSAEALLYAGARAQLVATKIRPAMVAGRVVINDRFGDSTLAYQGFGRGLSLDLLFHVNHLATGGLMPHLTFLLDIPPEFARKRLKRDADRLEQETISFFQRVREGYLLLAGKRPDSYLVLDACCPGEEIHRQVVARVEVLMSEVIAGNNRSQ